MLASFYLPNQYPFTVQFSKRLALLAILQFISIPAFALEARATAVPYGDADRLNGIR